MMRNLLLQGYAGAYGNRKITKKIAKDQVEAFKENRDLDDWMREYVYRIEQGEQW